jgi:hypothetical protein
MLFAKVVAGANYGLHYIENQDLQFIPGSTFMVILVMLIPFQQ